MISTKEPIRPLPFYAYCSSVLALSCIGIFISIYLSISHYRVHTDIGYQNYHIHTDVDYQRLGQASAYHPAVGRDEAGK